MPLISNLIIHYSGYNILYTANLFKFAVATLSFVNCQKLFSKALICELTVTVNGCTHTQQSTFIGGYDRSQNEPHGSCNIKQCWHFFFYWVMLYHTSCKDTFWVCLHNLNLQSFDVMRFNCKVPTEYKHYPPYTKPWEYWLNIYRDPTHDIAWSCIPGCHNLATTPIINLCVLSNPSFYTYLNF